MPAATALGSAPAWRRRLAFSYSPSCTCESRGVSPEQGSLRSSAAFPAPVTRRRSRQSCGMAHAQLISSLSSRALDALYHHVSLSDTHARGACSAPAPDHLGPLSEGIFSQDLFALLMLAGVRRGGKPASAANSAEEA